VTNLGGRTVDSVADDLVMLACAGIGSEELQGRTAQRVRGLVEEAARLATAQQRRATARAWSAWLELAMSVYPPGAGGKSLLGDLLDLEPGLRERLLAALEGPRG
jgi:hypothetical protein